MPVLEIKTKGTKTEPAKLIATANLGEFTYKSVTEKYGQQRADEIFADAIEQNAKNRISAALKRKAEALVKDSAATYDANKVAQEVADAYVPERQRSSGGANISIASAKSLADRLKSGEINADQFIQMSLAMIETAAAAQAAKTEKAAA